MILIVFFFFFFGKDLTIVSLKKKKIYNKPLINLNAYLFLFFHFIYFNIFDYAHHKSKIKSCYWVVQSILHSSHIEVSLMVDRACLYVRRRKYTIGLPNNSPKNNDLIFR